MKRWSWSMVGAAFLLAGCASDPPIRTYVLSTPINTKAEVSTAPGQSILQLEPVKLPDYLDTTDIIVRRGSNEIVASATGRWGERLSRGLGHALEADLGTRLPRDRVTLGSSSDRSDRRILVTINAFDVYLDGRCVLTASWKILGKDDKYTARVGWGTFITQATKMNDRVGDEVLVAAMASTVVELADRIALVADQ